MEKQGKLVIKDLEEDVELDAHALRAVSGGRSGPGGLRRGSGYLLATQSPLEESRLVRGLLKNSGLYTPEPML